MEGYYSSDVQLRESFAYKLWFSCETLTEPYGKIVNVRNIQAYFSNATFKGETLEELALEVLFDLRRLLKHADQDFSLKVRVYQSSVTSAEAEQSFIGENTYPDLE